MRIDTGPGDAGTGTLPGPAVPGGSGERTALVLQLIGGADAGTTVSLGPGRTTAGRDERCDLTVRDDAVSREHAVFDSGPGGIVVRDRGSTNGTTVEGEPVGAGGFALGIGDVVRIGGILLAVRTARPPADSTDAVVHPRHRRRAAAGPASFEAPDDGRHPSPHRAQVLAVVLPALGGVAFAWFLHSPVFLLIALVSPLAMLVSAAVDRRRRRRERRERVRTLGRVDERHRAEVAATVRAETVARRRDAPDAPAVHDTVRTRSHRLWERSAGDHDLLAVRVGSGDLPSRTTIRRNGTARPAATLPSVPVVVRLTAGPLGLVGPRETVTGLARWLVTQLVVLHPPSVVRLSLLLSSANAAQWTWARRLPHVDGRVAVTAPHRLALARDCSARHDAAWTVAVADCDDVSRLPLRPTPLELRDAAAQGPAAAARVSAIVLAGTRAGLPSWCTQVIDVRSPDGAALLDGPDATGATALGRTGPTAAPRVVLDTVRAEWAELLAQALGPLREQVAGPRSLPAVCHLLDVVGLRDRLDIDAVRERWGRSDAGAATVIGTGVDGPVEVDLARDGPHTLVAGTTGSGKSELLRTLVLGMALRHPPDLLSFVLVDFKGGAAFGDCADLPHVVGSVTDLDPHLTARALRSLDAELRRRERLFAAAGANDLSDYRRRAAGPPLARLVVVVDEFAALADELPDFVRGLVSVARRGRSLGLHLVLATQHPGAAVTPDIRANTALRIALRVVDAGESRELVGSAGAAAIPGDRPGRAVLSAGGTESIVQTACTRSPFEPGPPESAPSEPAPAEPGPSDAGVDEVTDAAAIVSAVVAAAEGCHLPASPWVAPLPHEVPLTSLTHDSPKHVPLGLLDLPAEQRRDTLSLDLATSAGWLLVGASRSGRTTALLTAGLAAARAMPPSQLEIYVVDGAGALAGGIGNLPHVVTCLGPGELASVPDLLDGLASRTHDGAAVLLLIDDAEQVLAPADGSPGDGGRLAGLLRRERVTVVAAGSRTVLTTRATASFEHRLLLRLADRADYALAGIAARDIPTVLPPGRAVRVGDAVEVQFARLDDAQLATETRRLTARWGTERAAGAVRVRPLPRTVAVSDLPAEAGRLRLGVGAPAAELVSLDPSGGARHWLIAGPSGSGRSTALAVLLSEAVRLGMVVIAIAAEDSPLRAAAGVDGCEIVVPGVGALPHPPGERSLVLVDDVERLTDTPHGELLTGWADDPAGPRFAVSVRSDDPSAVHQGLVVPVRRSRCGLLLVPGPLDGSLFGLTSVPRAAQTLPGGGLWVGAARVGDHPRSSSDPPLPIQVARPPTS